MKLSSLRVVEQSVPGMGSSKFKNFEGIENSVYFHFLKVNYMTEAPRASNRVVYNEAREINKMQTM